MTCGVRRGYDGEDENTVWLELDKVCVWIRVFIGLAMRRCMVHVSVR